MALKSKGFFLNLEEGTSTDQAIQMAPVRDLPVEDSEEEILAPIPAISKATDGSSTVETAKPAQVVETPSAPVASSGSLTTAQAIAAALAEAEAARPVVTLSTFAPEMLRPGRDLRSQPRRPGRNLKGFKDMASELFKS